METNPIHQQILKTLRTRVAQTLCTDEDKIPCFSPGQLLNILFLMNGQWGSIGDYTTTLRALHVLLGDLLWTKPETALENSQASTLVQ